MGICVFGRWLFGKPEYVKKREKIEEIRSEIDEVKRMIDQESVRFLKELEQISSDGGAKICKKPATFDEDIDRINKIDSPVVRDAETILVLANIDSEIVANTQETIQRLKNAKVKHDAVISRLIAYRDECYVRYSEIVRS